MVERAAQPIADAALERGLIVNAINSTSIRIAPPLIVGDAEIAEFAAPLRRRPRRLLTPTAHWRPP